MPPLLPWGNPLYLKVYLECHLVVGGDLSKFCSAEDTETLIAHWQPERHPVPHPRTDGGSPEKTRVRTRDQQSWGDSAAAKSQKC